MKKSVIKDDKHTNFTWNCHIENSVGKMKNSLSIMTRKRIHFCRVFYVFFTFFWWTTRSRNFQVYFTFCSNQWWSSAHLSEFAHFFASYTSQSKGIFAKQKFGAVGYCSHKIFIFARKKLTWHSNHALDSVRVLRIVITNWDCWICWVS